MAQRFDSPLTILALGRRIHETRKRRGLTLMDVERATAVNHGQISRIERGGFATNSENVRRLCKFLKIKHEAFASANTQHSSLKQRFEQLLLASPQYAMLFAAVLDALEVRASTAEFES